MERRINISKESQKSSSKDETLEVVLDDKTMKLIDDYVDKKINNETDNDDFLRLLMFDRNYNGKSAKIILDELTQQNLTYSFFHKFKRVDVLKWLEAPWLHEGRLKEVSRYLYNVSEHYKRLIKYFSTMAMFIGVLNLRDFNEEKITNVNNVKSDYNKACSLISNMNMQHEFGKILDIVFKEDIYYGYVYETKDSFYIRRLPSYYCSVRSVEDGVRLVTLDLTYFDRHKKILKSFDDEIRRAYQKYSGNKKLGSKNLRYFELSSDKGICIKFDESINYCVPPFAGVFSSLYDLEEYKNLKKNKEKLNNYKLLSLKIPVDDNGQFKIPEPKVTKYYRLIAANLPDNIGLALTPMEMNEHEFERAGQSNTDAVSEALEQYWSASGVSSLLFSSNKSGSAALKSSIAVDSALLYPIYRQFERWINLKLKKTSTIRTKFKIKLLDVTRQNYSDVLNTYTNLFSYGIGISNVLALLGYELNDFTSISYLEDTVLGLHNKIKPLQNSYTQSSSSTSSGTSTGTSAGRPRIDEGDLEIEGEKSREKRANEGA